jgi:hypothetical protein
VAISGLVFAALYFVSLVLVRIAVPADPNEPGSWLVDPSVRKGVRAALNLVPFTGIAFLWFMAVLRSRVGMLEDRFLATVFLGSGLLFLCLLFSCAAMSGGVLETFDHGPSENSNAYHLVRATAHALMNTFGTKMAAVFMFVSSTIALRTGMFARWIAFLGYALGSVQLLAITSFAWIALVFPTWGLLVSIQIVVADFRQGDRLGHNRSGEPPLALPEVRQELGRIDG